MKFGVALPNFGKYAKKEVIIEVAKTAEELGFDSLWVSDHVVIPNSHKGFGNVFYEPLTTLSFIASCTTDILLGTSVIIIPYRNPLVLAKMVSTLDVLSGGRVILGVGAGWLRDEFDALGVSYAERDSITDEYIKVLKILWTEDNPCFEGRLYKFSNFKFLPKPIQKPYPSIWVGGNSRKAIERAVNSGDGWHPVGLTPQEIKERANYLTKYLEKENRKPSDFVISLRKNLQVLDSETKIRGLSEKEILRGTADKIAEGIEIYRQSGVSYLIFQILGANLKGIFKTMKIFSDEIRPSLDM